MQVLGRRTNYGGRGGGGRGGTSWYGNFFDHLWLAEIFMEKCFLLVFALVKESKQGQDKIILLLIVILSPPPLRFWKKKCGKTKKIN